MRVPRLALVPPAVVLLSALAGCGGDEPEPSSPAEVTGVTCEYVEEGSPAVEVEPPPETPAPAESLTLVTNQGEIDVELRAQETPCAAGSFTHLAEQGFYDGTSCHRLTTEGILVLQCGDPTGTGSGGPGYRFADELSGDETYPPGTLAMANAGADTNGSQFFIVYGETPLPPSYTVFGTIGPAGLEVVQQVAAAGSDERFRPGDGAPNESVVIEEVQVG